MTTPTREQIDEALASCREWFSGMAFGAQQLARVHAIISAIPALTAELETERRIAGEAQSGWAHAIEERDAERKAHAETRLDVEHERKLRGLLEGPVGNAIELVVNRGKALGVGRVGQSIDECISDMLDKLAAWQTATGHASPKAYLASRIEPGDDLVETLLDVQERAEHAEPSWDARVVAAAGIRAILSFLALLGSTRVGRTEEETGVRVESAIETAYACNGCGLFASDPNDPCAQCDVPRLEAILGARRALETCRECHMADQHKLDCSQRFAEGQQ